MTVVAGHVRTVRSPQNRPRQLQQGELALDFCDHCRHDLPHLIPVNRLRPRRTANREAVSAGEGALVPRGCIWKPHLEAGLPTAILLQGHQQDPYALVYGHDRPGINLRATTPRELRAMDKATSLVIARNQIELTKKVESHECAVLHYSTDIAIVRFANRIAGGHVLLEAVQGSALERPGRQPPLFRLLPRTSLRSFVDEEKIGTR